MDGKFAWWHKECIEPSQALVQWCDSIDDAQADRHRRNERCLRMYGQDYQIGDSAVDEVYVPAKEKLNLNVSRSIADAIHSEMAQNRPKPMFLTGGDDMVSRWKLQRKARKLEQAVEGVFVEQHVYEKTSQALLDALIFDGSMLKVSEVGDEVKVERTFPFEIYVDPQEGIYGDPPTMGQKKRIDRAKLRAMFPKADEETFDNARRSETSTWFMHGDDSDMVDVYEGWRVACGDKPGRHLICTHGGELLSEPWDREDFPFVPYFFARLPVGYWGDSPVNQLTGIQYEIKSLMKNIQDAHHLLGKAFIVWPDASGAVKPQWNNGIGWILRVKDTRNGTPSVVTPQVVSPEIYRHLERLYQFAYEIVGASQLTAQAKAPVGLDSGRALLVYEDATSLRFLVAGRAWEQLHVELAHKIVQSLKRIYEKNPKLKLKYGSSSNRKQFLSSIPWKDVDMDEDMFRLQVYPTSNMPKSPAGRTGQVEQWINLGWIGPEEGMRLLDFPDVDAYTNLTTASWDVITKDLDAILDMDPKKAATIDEYRPPMPVYDLQLALRLSTGAFLCAHRDDAPRVVQDQLLRYIEDVKYLIEQEMIASQPPAPPPGPGPGPEAMPPGGPPMPPPGAMPPGGMPPEMMPPDGGMPPVPPEMMPPPMM